MVAPSLTERPIFASEEQEYLSPARPPLSRLAIVALFASLFGGLVMLNSDLIAVPLIGVVLGVIAYVQIARSQALSGNAVALAAVLLGVLFAAWSQTNLRLRDRYFYDVGSQVARQYLKVLGEGKMLEALELTKPEGERQVSGASLEEYYANVNEMVKERVDGYRTDPAVRKVIDLGPKAEWQLAQGVRNLRYYKEIHVLVRMVDTVSRQEVDVTLARGYGDGIGSWHILQTKLVDPHTRPKVDWLTSL